jgi:rRNA-processing protein FCF1
MATTFFLDTMILLHFNPITDIPWETLTDDSPIELRITMGVIGELDDLKDSHRNRRIRGRARRVLQQIEGWAGSKAPAFVRKDVEIRVHDDVLERASLEVSRKHDDELIAAANECQLNNASSKVRLVSDDTAVRRKARKQGLTAETLPDSYRLPLEPDPLEVENQRLREENRRLSRAPVPRLSIEFQDGQAFSKFILPRPLGTEEIVARRQRRLADLKTKYQTMALLASTLTAREERERFNAALPTFYDDHENYLVKLDEYEWRRSLTFQFTLNVRNIGRAPAQGVSVYLFFPDGMLILPTEELPPPPVAPDPPAPPRSIMEMPPMRFSASPLLRSLLDGPPLVLPERESNVSRVRIEKSNSYDVSWEVRFLKHGFLTEVGTVGLVFDRLESVKSFSVPYRVNAANMPDDTEGRLDFVFGEAIPCEKR